MRNIMVDLETIGTAPGSAILSIGACVFNQSDKDNGPFVFSKNIDLLDSIFEGLTVDPKTTKWWSEQSVDAVRLLTKNPVSLKGALNTFASFLRKDDCLWAKGPDFDMVLLKAAYDIVNIKVPWSFRLMRDVRTILALAEEVSGEKPSPNTFDRFVKHFALHDAQLQRLQVITAGHILGIDLEEMS